MRDVSFVSRRNQQRVNEQRLILRCRETGFFSSMGFGKYREADIFPEGSLGLLSDKIVESTVDDD
jgi:hypothetical protein